MQKGWRTKPTRLLMRGFRCVAPDNCLIVMIYSCGPRDYRRFHDLRQLRFLKSLTCSQSFMLTWCHHNNKLNDLISALLLCPAEYTRIARVQPTTKPNRPCILPTRLCPAMTHPARSGVVPPTRVPHHLLSDPRITFICPPERVNYANGGVQAEA